ncbi:hypothetical protein G6L30_16270 [Agrobacterium rhizogenes]|nr:hypothetical protein [Rhizobium rhizogenes]
MTDAISVIKGFEGYIDHAKWDRTAYRAGYGSDTTTLADGTKVPITADTVVTREDSERDLARRAADFENTAANQVGQDKWAALPGNVRAALTSTTYNYGSLPHDVVAATQTGDINAIASAVKGRGSDNGGINEGRRWKEAEIILGGPMSAADSAPYRPQVAPGVQYTAGTEVNLQSDTAQLDGAPRADAPEDTSLWQLQKDAFNQESTLAYLMNSNPYRDDPNFKAPSEEQRLQDLKDRGLDPEHYAKFTGGATSAEGYNRQLQNAQEDHDRLQRLQGAGMTGAALQIANQFLDPVSLATDVAVGAVAPQIVFGKRAGQVSRVLVGALSAGSGAAASTGLNYAVNPNATKADLLMGVAFGIGVGGVAGKLMSRGATVTEGAQLQRLAQRVVDDHEGVKMGTGFGGAAPTGIHEPRLPFEAPISELDHADVAKTAFGSVRADLSAQLDKSPLVTTRALGGALVQDGTGKLGGAVNGKAASEEAAYLTEEFRSVYFRTYKAQLQKVFDKVGTGVVDKFWKGTRERKFNDEVDRYVRDKQFMGGDKYSEEVRTVGKVIRDNLRELNQLQKNPWKREGLEGRPVFGHEEIPDNPYYMPREWQSSRIAAAYHSYADGTLEDLFFGAFRSANADMEEGALRKLSSGFVKSLTDRSLGLDDNFIRTLSGDNIDEMVELLSKHKGLSEEDAKEIAEGFRKVPNGDAGRDKHQRRRSVLDEDYQLPYKPRTIHGVTEDQPLSIRDFFNTDATSVLDRYTRNAAGNIAMARIRVADPKTGKLVIDGLTSQKEIDNYLTSMRQEAADRAVPKQTIEKDIKNVTRAINAIKGHHVDGLEGTEWGFWLRSIRKFNFSRIMNQAGFAAVPEIGNIVGAAGLKASLSQMPAVRRMMTDAGELALKDGLADDIEYALGIGTERLTRYAPSDAYDDVMSMVDDGSRGWRDHVSNALERANRVTADTSGMSFIDATTRRWAAKAIIQNFANMASKGKGISAKRLADLGLDEGMTKRVLAELKNPDFLPMKGQKVAGLRFDGATDKEAAEYFRRAIIRKTNQVIQKNDVGNLMPFMNTAVGKVIMQFRSFMAAAYVKNSLKALHMRDTEAMVGAAVTTGIAALTYSLQMQAQALGRSDREKFLEQRLAPANVLKAAVARSGWSSIAPMLIDTVVPALGGDAQFSYARTTGQTSNSLFGNPTFGLLDDISTATKAAAGIARPGSLSQEEWRAFARIAPFGNALPAIGLYNTLISDNPERMPRSAR